MNKKIAHNFAAATLTLSAFLLGTPAHALTAATIQATAEEMTIPDAQGFTVFNKESIVFTGCTADNHRVTSQFFLAADAAAKIRLEEQSQSTTKLIKFSNSKFEQLYTLGMTTITAREVAEDIQKQTIPLEIRQFMNAGRRVITAADGTINLSWRLKDTTVSAERDPSCNVKPK
jgi:hypothetical protein